MPKSATTLTPQGVVEFDFPIPPSLNRLWRSTSKGGKTRVYRDQRYIKWRANFWGHWLESKPSNFKTISNRFDAEVLVCPKRKRDADASAKAVLDAAQSIGIISNDGNARKVTQELVEKERAPLGCRLRIIPLG